MKRWNTCLLMFGIALLAACGQTGTPATNTVDELAALADADGDIETVLEVQTVPDSQYTATDDLWKFRGTNKPFNGVAFGAPSALKSGGSVRVKGRTFKPDGVPVFVGVAQVETAIPAAAGATPAFAPVVLMGAGQSFPAAKGTDVAMEESVLAWTPRKLTDMEIILFKRANGKPGLGIAFNGSQPGGSSLKPAGLSRLAGERSTTLKGTIQFKQTNLGPVGTLEGYTATDDLWKWNHAVVLGWSLGASNPTSKENP